MVHNIKRSILRKVIVRLTGTFPVRKYAYPILLIIRYKVGGVVISNSLGTWLVHPAKERFRFELAENAHVMLEL